MPTLIADAIMRLFDIHKLRQSDNCPLNSLQAEYIIKSLEGNTMRIQKVERLIYVAIALIVLIGCTNIATSTEAPKTIAAATELWGKLKYYNDKYCSVENTLVRETLVAIVRDTFPEYPEGGLCEEEHKFTEMINKTNSTP
jgi:hypothetical protein